MSEDRARYTTDVKEKGESKTMDILQVIENQIKGLEEAAAATTDAEQKIKIAQTISELVKSQGGLLIFKSIENAIRQEFKGLSEEEVKEFLQVMAAKSGLKM